MYLEEMNVYGRCCGPKVDVVPSSKGLREPASIIKPERLAKYMVNIS